MNGSASARFAPLFGFSAMQRGDITFPFPPFIPRSAFKPFYTFPFFSHFGNDSLLNEKSKKACLFKPNRKQNKKHLRINPTIKNAFYAESFAYWSGVRGRGGELVLELFVTATEEAGGWMERSIASSDHPQEVNGHKLWMERRKGRVGDVLWIPWR